MRDPRANQLHGPRRPRENRLAIVSLTIARPQDMNPTAVENGDIPDVLHHGQVGHARK